MAEKVQFPSSTGPMLGGLIDLPEGKVRGWGVFSHGFTLGKDSHASARICRELAREGVGMLRFDALGLGDSEGDWGDGSFTVKTDDVIQALRFMAERGTPADLLVGHSWGGAAVLAAARQAGSVAPLVKAVATIAAPYDPTHVEHHYDAVVAQALDDGAALWQQPGGGRQLTLKKAFVEDVKNADIRDKIRELRLPLLILHSPTDTTVDISNAGDIFTEARHPKSFVALEGSDHLLTAPGQARRASHIISAWSDMYLGD